MRKNIALVGLRAGDEGKGTRVLYYVKRGVKESQSFGDGRASVLTYRWQGGANAGHTAVIDDVTYKLHQVPAGILIPEAYNLQTSGVYLSPRKEVKEIEVLRKQGISISQANLGIASNAFVTLDHHIDEDTPDLSKGDHTSTGNGIRQTAREKYARLGMRFAEFLNPREFISILEGQESRARLGDIERLSESYDSAREALAPFLVLQDKVWAAHGTKYQFGEGANGFAIDVEEGLYPGTSSSHIAHFIHRPSIIAGVVKLYESSVGHGRPFVSRFKNRDLEATLREKWGEKGTTTGKPRQLGWLDLVGARHAVESMDVDHLIGTCGDRLADFDALGHMNVGIVTGYRINGKTYDCWDESFHRRGTLYEAEPVVEEFKSWNRFVDDSGKVHPNAQRFLDRIQQFLKREFALLGTGPGIDDVIEPIDLLNADRVGR